MSVARARRLLVSIVVPASLVLSAGSAGSQDFGAGWAIDMGNTGLGVAQWSSVMNGAIEAGRSGRPSVGFTALPALKARPGVAAGAASTSYRQNAAVTARVKQQYSDYVSKTAGRTSGEQVRSLLARQDPVRSWSQVVASDGLRPGDVADALAAYWVLNWMIANQGDNNRAQTLAVKNQVRATMSSNPAFTRLNEAQRQEMAEVLMLNFLAQHAAYLDAYKRRDQAMLRRLGDAAVTRFRNEMGVDLRQLQLTNNGFVRRG